MGNLSPFWYTLPGRPGSCLPGLPQIRTCPIKASGSSIRGFALRPRYPEELHAQGFESRCTRPVSRLRDRGQAPPWLRRVPVGPVPRLHSYYEVLRTPTALSAGLRFLRPAVTTFAPVFVPLRPDAGRWAWSCCVAAPTTWRWRRSGLPGSWGTLMCLCPGLRPRQDRRTRPLRCVDAAPAWWTAKAPATWRISGLDPTASALAVYASPRRLPGPDARLASRCWPSSTGRD